jgi:hypothetical protein
MGAGFQVRVLLLSLATLAVLGQTPPVVEDADGLPTTDKPESGSLNDNRIARDYSRVVCEMIMQGGLISTSFEACVVSSS